MKKTRKVTASLSEEQFAELESLMTEDGQTNFTFYIVYLIHQEKKNREGNRKNKVGRPKKEVTGDELWYPCPYDVNGPPYTMDDLTAYYTFRNEKVPPQPAPFTKEELKKWDL